MFNLKKIGTTVTSEVANNAASALAEEAGIENEELTGAIGDATGQIVEDQIAQELVGSKSEAPVARQDSDMTGL